MLLGKDAERFTDKQVVKEDFILLKKLQLAIVNYLRSQLTLSVRSPL